MSEQEKPLSGTIAAAREKFFDEARQKPGTTCRCCDRFGKIYARKINATMARALIRLYKTALPYPRLAWVHFSQFTETRNEYEKLQFWGLIERRAEHDDPKTKSSGFWRITDAGVDFVTLKSRVPEKAIVYNKQLRGFEGREVSINDALGKKFHYAELMADAPTAVAR